MYNWVSPLTDKYMYIDDIVGTIGGGNNEIHLFMRTWDRYICNTPSPCTLNSANYYAKYDSRYILESGASFDRIYRVKITNYDQVTCTAGRDTKLANGITMDWARYRKFCNG